MPYSCADSTKLPGNQPAPFEVECDTYGKMDYPATFPTCRAKSDCSGPYPAPPANKHLLNTTASGLKEFEYAQYSCKPGATLEHLSAADIVNNKFRVQCQLGGGWPSSINWPLCRVDNCVAPPGPNKPYMAGFTKVSAQSSVAIGAKLEYSCQTGGDVLPDADGGNGNGKLEIECLADGEFKADPGKGGMCRDPCQVNKTD